MTLLDSAETPIISIVMPVFNPHPIYFQQALQSLLEQTLSDLEVIIIEDPSLRTIGDLPVSLADPRIRYYLNPHRTSLVEQRNLGLEKSRAPLVAMLDADDIAERDRLEKQINYLSAHADVTVLGSQVSIIDEDGMLTGYRRYPVDHDSIVRKMASFNPIAQPAVMFRKEPVVESGAYKYGRYPANEDYELWCRLAARGARFANHPDPLVRYRIHPQGMKTSKLRGIIRGTLEIKQMYWGNTMGMRERTRMLAERMLLWLPPQIVLRLFMKTHFVNRLPGA